MPDGCGGAALAVAVALGCVVGIVAALAECGQVARVVVGWVVVEVSDGEHDARAGDGVRLVVLRVTPFASGCSLSRVGCSVNVSGQSGG